MKRPLRPEEQRLWSVVAATVRPSARNRLRPPVAPPPESPTPSPHIALPAAAAPAPAPVVIPPDFRIGGKSVGGRSSMRAAAGPAPDAIEPNRRRRIARNRDPIAARLDLHGYDQDHARNRLLDFLLDAQADGARAVLVITGKGFMGEGVLRRRAPEWLADPRLRSVVAGLSPADPQHGGAGAWYVALKRKPR